MKQIYIISLVLFTIIPASFASVATPSYKMEAYDNSVNRDFSPSIVYYNDNLSVLNMDNYYTYSGIISRAEGDGTDDWLDWGDDGNNQKIVDPIGDGIWVLLFGMALYLMRVLYTKRKRVVNH